MSRRLAFRAVLITAGLTALAACTPSASPGPTAQRAQLGISNGTTLAVTLVVNGERIADYAAGTGATIDLDALPPLPWDVTAQTSAGRVLTSMDVAPESAGMPGGTAGGGTFGRVDLSCGRLTIWAGDSQPSGPAPPPSPGAPGDCEP